ncbi:MAG: adenosine-specific kinase, partial [Candidatus Korarchaeum sp.]
AVERALKIGAGHSLVIVMRDAWPINVLPRLRQLPEIATVYAATSNPLKVIVAEYGDGRGILGVIDGGKPLGVEGKEEIRERMEFLRRIGYKHPSPE